jgi:glucokinase
MDDQVIGIDLGGTAIKLGRFRADGSCQQSLTVDTPQPATPKAVVEVMKSAIARLIAEAKPAEIKCIGIGMPGPTDVAGRVALVAINLSGWQNVPLAGLLEQATGLPVILANDANCAGLGETWLGAGRGCQNAILLTLGTGVGGAVILNGHLFTGHYGSAAELGLITINFDGPACNSGNQGSLEQYVSVQAIRRETGKEPLELAKLAENGDAKAIAYWQNYGQLLGAGLASLIYIFTPEVIILGGGISAGISLFLPSTQAEIEKRVLAGSRIGLKIVPAKLGNQAGMVGAAKLAWDKIS